MENSATSSQLQTAATPRFFFTFSCVLIAIVLIGFAPTLFLRFLSDPLPIPWYLHLHGMLLSVWFVWLAVQTWHLRSGNVALHRRLGYFGAAYAVIAICGGLMATLGVVPRALEGGITLDSDIAQLGIAGLGEGISFLAFISGVVWTNMAMVLAFAILVGAAVIWRRDGALHKRFMLLATIAFTGPALARISRWPGFGGEQGPFIPVSILVLMGAVIVYDLISRRRVHSATVIGIVLIMAALIGGNIIATTEFGQNFVRGLA